MEEVKADIQPLSVKGSRYFAALVILISAMVLVGWLLNIEYLKRPVPNTVAMNPMTALAFALTGLALFLLSIKQESENFSVAIKIISVSAATIGLIKIIALITAMPIEIDQWLFPQKLINDEVGNISNRMAPNTAFNFLLLGIALFLSVFPNKQKRDTANLFAFLVLILSSFALIGYLYRVKEFYGLLHYIPMALHTAICFIFVSFALLLTNGKYGFMRSLMSERIGGYIARRLIPAVILIPVLLGLLRLWVFWQQPYSVELGMAAFIICVVILFFGFTLFLSVTLNKSDTARIAAEVQLKQFNKNLELKATEKNKEILDYKFALDESAIVAITDQKGIIKHANDNFCKISRYTREELIGQDHRIINSGYHPKEFIRNLWITIANGKIWKGELKNKAKDGTIYWVDTTIVPFLNEQGKPYQYIAIRADITEWKKLEEQQVLFASIVNSSDDAIISKNLDGIITSWNHGAEKMFGYTAKEIIGKHISVLIPTHLQNEEKEILEKAKKGEGVDHRETERKRKDGKPIYVSLTISPIRDSLGNIIGASKISRNITERKKAEEQIRALNENLEQKVKERTLQLEAVNKELESFSYSVSHDLRAPLRAVSGYTQMLKEDYGSQMNEDAGRIMNNIMGNAKRMGQLIDDLLTFSRLGRKELNKSDVSMNGMVNEVCKELNDEEDHRLIEYKINNLPNANADRITIRQVWVNLLANALKYSRRKEKTVIEIGSKEAGQEITYYVKDNGAGFDMRYADKLFGVFQRLHSEEEFQGTGVGLAIVQRIVFKHGGSVWAEGKVNEGATFYFTLNKP